MKKVTKSEVRLAQQKTQELVQSLNEDGLEAWDGVIISCAKTGRIFQSEPVEFSCDAHAEIDNKGRLVFVLHYDDFDPVTYH